MMVADLSVAVEVCRWACLVELGRPTERTVGDLPGARAVPLTSNVDINERGRRRQSAAAYGISCEVGLQPRRPRIELLKRLSQVRNQT
jgi:hypothetical protein